MRHAFTLVELSIVLVILGLLIGGVLTGQTLIHAAEIRAIGTESTKYTTAVYTFRDKYFAIPGDMTNATAYWGTAASCPGDYTTPSTTATTCNGDGNGQLSLFATSSMEPYRAWQHLANAGLVEGSYTGVAYTSSIGTPVAGVNVARTKYSSQHGWNLTYIAPQTGSTTYYNGSYGNIFQFALYTPTFSSSDSVPTQDAYNVDKKYDDGMAGSGKIMGLSHSYHPGCTVSATDSSYNVANTGATACGMLFITGF